MSAISAASLFVVSGGGRGVTAQCVLGLARRYRCRFILVGRTALEAEPAWAAGCEDEAELKSRISRELRRRGDTVTPASIQRTFAAVWQAREVRGTLQQLAAAGSAAEYVVADVADAQGLAAALGPALARLGPAAGLIHGAGAVSDKPVERKTVEDFETVYGPKVRGLQNLLACVPIEHLRWLVLFSSAAGFFGNAGQTDYALANEILNRAAHRLRKANTSCHVISFNWGPWDAGMVTPELSRRFQELGIQIMSRRAGVEALVNALEDVQTPPQVLVGEPWLPAPADPPKRRQSWTIRRRLSIATSPMVLDHAIDGHPVLPAVCAAGWLARAGEQLNPGWRFAAASDLRVLKGIVFDGSLAPEHVLQIDEQHRSADEIHYTAVVKSQLGGKERFHYAGTCVLRRTLPARAQFADFDPREDSNAVDGRSLYREGLLFHGPTFQGIQRVLNVSQDRITLRCRLAPVDPRMQGQFDAGAFNPYLADVQLQSVLVWALMMRGVGGHPLHLESIEVLVPPRFDELVYVSTRIRRADETAIVGDCLMHDEAGRISMRCMGAALTPNVSAEGLLVGAGSP